MSDIAWDQIADLYDLFNRADFDIPFFLGEAGSTSGEVLELMAGTGRVSLALARAGARLTCVDRSPKMLEVLRRKLERGGLAATVLQADVRALKLGKTFDLILLPFHSFSELLEPEDRREALAAIRRHLAEGGRFICTLQNPAVRLKAVDGQVRLWGQYALDEPAGNLLMWGLLDSYDPATRRVHGWEFFELYDLAGGMQARRATELRFAMLAKDEFEDLAREAGFHVLALYGDYACGEFRPESSPFMIWSLG